MLSRLRLTSFKSWREADLQCGRITGLFGTNSSGKTSLIQFLLLLKQTKDATDRAISLELNGDLVQLGTIRDAIHRHEDNRNIDWEATFDRDEDLVLDNVSVPSVQPIARARTLTVGASIAIRKEAPYATRVTYSIGNHSFALTTRGSDRVGFDLSPVRPASSEDHFAFVRTQGRAWQLPGPVKGYAFPDQVRTYFQNAGFLADLEAAYESELDNVFYLGSLREFPQRDYLWSRSRPTDVGRKGGKAIDAILAATASGEKRNLKPRARLIPFQEMITYWLHEMGLVYSFKMEEIAKGSNRWQARVQTKPGASEALLTDVGFGISQVLPVVTLLQYVPEGGTVILEQPEIHLHPLAQAALADVIIQAAQHRRVQVILESHSEHLLLRLQRRIAEGAVSATDVKLYFCNAPKGVSTLTPLEVDMFGNIRNWPDKFMGDAFTEVAEAEKARLLRMSAAQ